MEWVQRMNTIRSAVDEIVKAELILNRSKALILTSLSELYISFRAVLNHVATKSNLPPIGGGPADYSAGGHRRLGYTYNCHQRAKRTDAEPMNV